jgi:hypothetical protein
MQRKTRRLIIAVALIGALAAGGAAYTAGNNVADQTVGYYAQNIVGTTANSVTYNISADGTTINSVDVVVTSDISGKVIKAGFNDSLTDNNQGGSPTCTTNSFTTTQTVHCTFSESSQAATKFSMLVTDS